MATSEDSSNIQALAHQIWEEEGRPHGQQRQHWAEAQRRLHGQSHVRSEATLAAGLEGDASGSEGEFDPEGYQQDTPGRPKTASSRQQTQPGQTTLTGSAEVDKKSSAAPPVRKR